jgi:glucose/arabinose dehydrogenase
MKIAAKTICADSLLLLTSSVWARTVTTVASGLNGPREMKFGPDGALYVGEAGTGGPTATVSRIAPDGERTTAVSGLASALSSLPSGDTQGAADVAFLGSNLYVLVGGGGCSHGNPDAPARDSSGKYQ